MAKALKDKVAGQGHNSKSTSDQIIDPDQLIDEIRAWSADMDIFDEQARSLGAKKKKRNQEFKAKTGITIADTRAARRWAQIEDEGERYLQSSGKKLTTHYLLAISLIGLKI